MLTIKNCANCGCGDKGLQGLVVKGKHVCKTCILMIINCHFEIPEVDGEVFDVVDVIEMSDEDWFNE